MNIVDAIKKTYSNRNFEAQIYIITIFINSFFNSITIGLCTFVANLPMDYTIPQLAVLTFLSAFIVVSLEIIFNHIFTRSLSNNIFYWQSTEKKEKERTELLTRIGSYPRKKATQLVLTFILNGIIYSAASRIIMNVDLHISVFYYHLYLSICYISILITLYIIEAKCSKIAITIVQEGIETSERKIYGLSQKTFFILYVVIPIIGSALITLHAIIYSLTPQTVHSVTQTMTSRILSDAELMGFAIKTTFTRNEIIKFILKISFVNSLCAGVLIYFYYSRFMKNTNMMQDSLLQLQNKKIDQKNLFHVDMFTEVSYTMQLINKTILLFDSIIRNNARTNMEIEEATKVLSAISNQTKDNVIQQSSNIEEILATMQSVDNLSKKIESSFDEVIAVASKTQDNVSYTSLDLNENLKKIQEITTTNKVTIENLKNLSSKINGIHEVINAIDKIAEQTKTVAFNAELEASNIDVQGINFVNVAEEIRNLSDYTTELTKKVHRQLQLINQSSEELIATGNYCMKKTEEGNNICIEIGTKFESIKKSSHETSSNSVYIKESLHQQTNTFHMIVETLSQISQSVRNFGESSMKISEAIEKLMESSSHILALNNKYNKQEGNAI